MNKFLNFLYPPSCQLCGSRQGLIYTGRLCVACAADFHLNQLSCSLCAIPLSRADSQLSSAPSVCPQCTKNPPVIDLSWSPFIYAQPLEWMIQQLKFNAKLNFAPLLSKLMLSHFPQHLYENNKPDIVIPMPLHKRRLKQRGFNQAVLLAQPIVKELALKIDLNACERIRDTPHQTGKNAKQRKQNIKNAFTFNNKKNYQHVVVFDDVVTTGSSVCELTKTLKREGVKRVDVWSLARAEKS